MGKQQIKTLMAIRCPFCGWTKPVKVGGASRVLLKHFQKKHPGVVSDTPRKKGV